MSKKLNIIEAMKMPIGTEFKMIRNGADMPDNVYIDSDTCFRYKRNDNPFPPYADNILSIFIPIQQPVSFMEVVAKAKTNRFRIEHELFKSHSDLGHTLITTLNIMARYFNNDQIADIILNGKCYIEESEELEDERLS